ncbi:hypothetical protein EYF80_040486 [Liparis tanakae]|uniref:Uncharacterized protein n=1 Tax=Liparis tanakae TaxID=230148 RepID=A0A4Z2G7X9_9TELE|nr:hypothetical protein EYF80_040486 [Liparis tanakae]
MGAGTGEWDTGGTTGLHVTRTPRRHGRRRRLPGATRCLRGSTRGGSTDGSKRFSLNRRRAAAHPPRRDRDRTPNENNPPRVCVCVPGGEGSGGRRDGRRFECCHFVKASAGCRCTLTPVAKTRRPGALKGSGSRIQARIKHRGGGNNSRRISGRQAGSSRTGRREADLVLGLGALLFSPPTSEIREESTSPWRVRGFQASN